ncbi:MAG: DUF86 domain-containing protein [Cyanobacteria bacterium P01_C01_bin.89]
MSSRTDAERLDDILQVIADIETDVAERDQNSFFKDSMAVRSVLYSFTVIGEASSKLAQRTQDKSPSTPWKNIKGMRNFIAHEYFRVNQSVIWNAIQNELPALKSAVESILNS